MEFALQLDVLPPRLLQFGFELGFLFFVAASLCVQLPKKTSLVLLQLLLEELDGLLFFIHLVSAFL